MINKLIQRYLSEYDPGIKDPDALDSIIVVVTNIHTICDETENFTNLVLVAKLLDHLPNVDMDLLKMVYNRALEYVYNGKVNSQNPNIDYLHNKMKVLNLPDTNELQLQTQAQLLKNLKISVAHLLLLTIRTNAMTDLNIDRNIVFTLASFLSLKDLLKFRRTSKSANEAMQTTAASQIPYCNQKHFLFATSGNFSNKSKFSDAWVIYRHTLDTQLGKDEAALLYKIHDIEAVHRDGTYKDFAKHCSGFNGRIYCPELTETGRHDYKTNMTWVLSVIHCNMTVFVYSPLTEINFYYTENQHLTSRTSAFAAEISGFMAADYEVEFDSNSQKLYLFPPQNMRSITLNDIIFPEKETFERAKETGEIVEQKRCALLLFSGNQAAPQVSGQCTNLRKTSSR